MTRHPGTEKKRIRKRPREKSYDRSISIQCTLSCVFI